MWGLLKQKHACAICAEIRYGKEDVLHRLNKGFVHGSSMVRPWFVHRFRGFRWRNHGQTMEEP